MTGTLYLVPNTLDFGIAGELQPIDQVLPRAVLTTAARLRHWVAENAKTTRAFLKRIDGVEPLGVPLQSVSIVELPTLRKGAPPADSPDPTPLLAPLAQGHDIGLISEAGLPAVADPGATLVAAAHWAGARVVALPGPSALLLALAASGLGGQSFAFIGYLPVAAPARTVRIRETEAVSRRWQQTQIAIETPYRNEALFASLLAVLAPTTRLSVSCGLTLPSGFSRTDTVARWKQARLSLPGDVPAVFAYLA